MPSVVKEAPAPTVLPGLKQETGGGRLRFLTSALVVSLAVFSLLNLLLWNFYGNDKSASKDLWSGTGSIDLVLNDFNSYPAAAHPNIVLMGSSLMMFPFWAMDKDRYPVETSDIFHYHRSRVLEQNLEQAGFSHPTVFNMAIFGQMASDAFLYVDECLKGTKRPDYLVLGIAPRDFSDADVPSPMSTMSFKRMVTLENFPKYAQLYLPTWQSKLEFVAEHICFFYGKRWHLQREFDKAMLKASNMLSQACGLNTAGAAYAAPSHSTSVPNIVNRGFLFGGTTEERWHNSLDEYRRRYHNIDNNHLSMQLAVQLGFFNSLLDLCKQRGIKVIVVNMPLTDANRALLPPGWYSGFSQRLAAECQHSGARYLDLGDSTEFAHSDYWDTTHLAHPGGYKLVNTLAPVIESMKYPLSHCN
jgi:hypothetical protein